MPDPTAPVPVSVESEGNDGFRFEQRPTAPVTAEGSYEWWRAEVASRDEELERLRGELAEAKAEVERLAEFGVKERERHEVKLASLQAFADRCREKDWAHSAEQAKRREQAEAERDDAQKRADWLRGHAEWLSDERDALKAAVQHLAAEAHRRKWVHEGSPAFGDFHRLGNELLAALAAPAGNEDAPTGGWLTWQKLMGTEPPPFPAILENPDAPTGGED
jgi:chromosome segregation ATPase